METVLAKIVADKASYLATRQQRQPLAEFLPYVIPSSRHFYRVLSGDRCAFILECKKASPSKGLIRADFDPVSIARVYRDYASAISVLTDEKYFQGDFEFMRLVSENAPQPILCKDFIIDPYQILLARYYQADACLLMLSVLDDEKYRQLVNLAHSLNMGVLTEVSNRQELTRAITLQAQVVGINNRDLRDLSIDTCRTREFAPCLPKGVTVISESGIYQHRQVRELRQFSHGFLIGSALMANDDLHRAVRSITLGDNKVCGLTSVEDAKAVYQAGAVYGGLIFVPDSPRAVTLHQAEQIINASTLSYVAVFRNASLDNIVNTTASLPFAAIQLHGDEDQNFISQLRDRLHPSVQIWKALSMGNRMPARELQHVDRYLLDNGKGGSGQCFNWSLLNGKNLDNTMLAGGLTPENCASAAAIGCIGLDFNSGVESAPGIKQAEKLTAAFQALREY